MDALDTRLDPWTTYHYDKISCSWGFFAAHIFFAYLMALTGFFCFISRAWPRFHAWHAPLGRVFILSLLWCTATSLLIHNTGLPTGVLVSFLWVMGGVTIGWALINIHQVRMGRAAAAAAGARLKAEGLSAAPGGDLAALLAAERGAIAGGKSWSQRLLSLKAAHGAIMFVAWINVVGRIFATPGLDDFTCHTYPFYKQIDTPQFSGAGKPLTPVPTRDPAYPRLPWARMGPVGWGAALLLGPLAGALIIGAIWSAVAGRAAARGRGRGPAVSDLVTPVDGDEGKSGRSSVEAQRRVSLNLTAEAR